MPDVKSIIINEYIADPANVKAVFLLGQIPLPYSGYLNPDGHSDHKGAWPADAYYADMDGSEVIQETDYFSTICQDSYL